MNTESTCRICDNPLPSDTGWFCRESCYLTSLHAGYALYDDTFLQFSEALDLREHRTGQHSRRVACHTLVLAQLTCDDDAELKQIYWGAR